MGTYGLNHENHRCERHGFDGCDCGVSREPEVRYVASRPRRPRKEVPRDKAVIGSTCPDCKKDIWFASDIEWDPNWRCDRCSHPALYAAIDALEARIRALEAGRP